MIFKRKLQKKLNKKSIQDNIKINKNLTYKIISTITAVNFTLNPMLAYAQNIQASQGSGTLVENKNNGVTDIWAGKVVGDTGVNIFDHFKLDANNIANMYFQQKGSNSWQNNLVNFVNERIDVNGTINAIKDNKIGGNLFFLSKDGMAVGQNGVINAGALSVMTPTASFYEKIVGSDGKSFNEQGFTDQWENIQKAQIPINAQGTISVAGKINTVNGINLKASSINIEQTGALTNQANVNFADLVNIKKSDGSIVNAGLNGDLTLKADEGSGDIILTAVASDVNKLDNDFEHYEGSDNVAEASVTVDGNINSHKDVKITAEATNGVDLDAVFSDGEIVGNDDSFTEAYGQLRKNIATVNINGEVTGEHVDIQANTINNFITGEDEDINLGIINDAVGMLGPNLQGAYGVLANDATVNVNENAIITANAAAKEGENALNISANSKLQASIGASTTAIKLANIKSSITTGIPATAVTYAETDNKATVNIKGTLKSNGNTNIEANADSKLEATALSDTTQLAGDLTKLNVGVLVASGKNKSEVNIENTAELSGLKENTAINGNLNIAANSTNSVNTQALATGKENALASTAINVTSYDSGANVNIKSDIKAKDVDIEANNIVLENSVSADNSVGGSMISQKVIQKVVNTMTVQQIKDLGTKLKDTIVKSSPSDPTIIDKAGNMISVGASVGVVNEHNNAKVNISNGADIQATNGDVDIKATNTIIDTKMSANGISSNYNDDSNNKVLVNASVLYTDMENDASVVIDGSKDKNDNTQITGTNVNITAQSQFQYNRVNRMIGDLLLAIEKLKASFGSNEQYNAYLKNLEEQAKTYQEKLNQDPNYANNNEGNQAALNLAALVQEFNGKLESDKSAVEQTKDIFTGPFNVLGVVGQFANPSNYANFQTGSSTGGKDNGASVAVAGSANITNLTNNANVLIGKNTDIKAVENTNLKANVAQEDVSLVGKIMTGGGDTSVGGNLNLYFGDTNSLITIGEGSSIDSGKININSDNDISHTGVTFGAGKAGKVGITGMVNIMEGDSNSLISIDDEATLTATKTTQEDSGNIDITSHNNTTITNIAGNAAMGTTAGIGASVGVTNYNVNNIVAIGDNDVDNTDEEKSKIIKIIKDKSGLTEEQLKNVLGSNTKKVNGSINASNLNVDLLSDGMINTVTVAGSAVTGSDHDAIGIGDKLKNVMTTVENKFNGLVDTADKKVQGLFGNELNGVTNSSQGSTIKYNPTMGQALPKLTVSGAGSSSVNLVNASTSAIIDGANINLKSSGSNDGNLSVKAKDNSFIGAWSGAAAISWKTTATEQNWNNKSVGISGAIGINQTDTDVSSIIKNSTIKNAKSITNVAEKSGALVAAGLSLGLSKDSGGGAKYNGTASVSYNESDNEINAIMQNNTVSTDDGSKTNLTNSAYNSDTQVTGGLNTNIVAGGDKGMALGGTATVSNIKNNVNAQIIDGTYTNMGDIEVSALTDITQVSTAVGVSVDTAMSSSTNFQGEIAYNKLDNNINASIEGATITTDSVSVVAQDTTLGAKKYDEYINERGIDATGDSYLNNISDQVDDLHDEDGNLNIGKTGNKIVAGSLGINVATGSGSKTGTAAVSINDINNDFNAKINGTITAKENKDASKADVSVLAKSDSLIVDIAAGNATSTQGFGAAGSISWQTLNSDVKATIENSTIVAGKTEVNALNAALGVNVAGQLSTGKNSAGLAIAYNSIENNTGAYILGSDISNGDKDTEITLNAQNEEAIYAVGAGVSAGLGNAALNGSIGINRGNNNAEAIIDKYGDKRTTIKNVKKLNVNSSDNTRLLAVAGGITASKGVAIGGAVAYNEIGNISGDDEEAKKQNNIAQINNTDITTSQNIDKTEINVKATDNSQLTTVGVGVGGSGSVAVQGAAATSIINKDIEASLTNTNINENINDTKNNTNVEAVNNSNITSSASVASGSGTASVGAGVAVNQINQDTKSSINGGTYNIKNINLNALSKPNIENIGIGGSVGGTAGITGSVAVNQIHNDTTASISDGATIVADGNVGVVAQSDESIKNYAGGISGGGTAGVGMSVSVNQIDGNTLATISGVSDKKTNVTAKGHGNDVVTTNSNVSDDQIHDELISDETVAIDSKINRKEEQHKGIVVDASSTHDIKSFIVNGGVAGTAGVAGTVNVNTIGGRTGAEIKHTVLNGGSINSNDVGNLFIQAGDYTNSAGFVGSLGVGITGAGVGMASDTAIIDRETSATLENSDVKAKDMAVQAISKQGISSFGVGAGIAGIGGGVAGLVTVTELNNKTSANLLDNKINANTIKVNADHYSAINAGNVSVGGAGIGAGVGLSVGVLKDNSDTQVNVKNTDSKDKNTIIATNDIDISANNKVKVAPMISATGIGAAGVAGATSVNNLNSTVKTNIGNVKLQSKQGSITVEANNKIIVDSYIGGNAAGMGGVGASVTVNTIDSTVQTNVDNSDLEAKKDISLTANEERDIEQLATNAVAGVSGALGANIVVTNIGTAIDNEDVKNAIEQANNVYGDFNLSDYSFGMTEETKNPTVGAGLGGDKNSQITVNANNSKFEAGNKFTANASEIDNIAMTAGSGTLGSIAVNAGVGILNVNRHTGIDFTGKNEIIAKDADLTANVSGTTKLDIYQGSAGIFGANAAYGKVTTAGSSSISLDGVNFRGNTNSISIKANDEGITSANILGISAGIVSVGAIVAEAENQSSTVINIEDSEIENAENTTIEANKSNTVEAHATGGSGGVISGNGVVAIAKDVGISSITLGDNNNLQGKILNLNAIAKPSVTAIADSVNVSILGSAGASVATAETLGSVNISVGENNTLANDDVNIEAKVETQSGKDTTTAKVEGNSGSIYVSTSANVATATTNIDVNVDIDKAKYKTKTEEVVTGYKWSEKGDKQEIKKEVTTGLTNLKVNATNTTSTVADARGVTIGGLISSGNNVAKIINNSDTTINLTGGSKTDKVLLKSLSTNASGTTNTKATANGDGGGLISGDLAGYVDNQTNTNTTINMNGSWSTDGNINIQASQSDKVNMNANALKATVVGASATKAVNNITGNTTVNINDAELTSTGTVDIGAVNTITVGDEQKYAVEGSGYGGINVQGAELDNTINKSTDVKLTNAKIYSVGTQTLEAKTIGNINVGGYIKAAGLGAATWVDVDNSITTNNKITVDGNSAQKTTGIGNDIILSANDDMIIKVDGVADTQGGAAGGASSDVTNTLNRNNKVNISGDIYAMQDVNIYAGKDKNGNEGRLELTINSEAYNKTALAVASPKYKNTMTQNNQVLINKDAQVDSVRNINLYADAGKEKISENSIMYTWYYSDKNGSYTSSSVGDKEPANKQTDNFVQNDGKLTAGVQNKQYITIGGDGQIVFLDPNTLEAVKNVNGQENAVGANGIKIDGSGNLKDNIEFGTMDYGIELFNRYNELNDLISNYSENKNSAAYLGYVAERDRILEQMNSLGLLQEMTTDTGEKILKPVEGMTIDYVSLPDIIASGGNINIQSDNLKGSGDMTAKGAPEINIVNNTNLYLKVNDVVIGDAGGEIIFNNQSLKQDTANEQINNINTKYKDSKLNITVEDSKATGSINIEGNYGGGIIQAEVTDPVTHKKQTMGVVPKADIEINGVISNANGIINITSKSDSIIIQGEQASSSAGVTGKEVHLNAEKGSVSQGYTDGIVSIGGSVQDIYDDQYNQFKNDMDKEYGFDHDQNEHKTQDGKYVSAKGNMIVGENIYINASDINVNGYMQSGYGDYELNIDASVQDKINQIQQNWQNNGQPNLADAVVTTGDAYRIVIGDNIWDEKTGSYIKAVEAYYNPATGKIIVPDIDAHGGQVHLTGRISSTGGGTIKVLDGAYDINVNNKTNTDLQLGKLVSNDVEGLISITDTGKNTITEMRRGNTIVKKYNDKTNQWEITSDEDKTATEYKPEEGLRYNWTTGQESVTKEEYKNTVKKGLWGLVETKNETELTEWEQSNKPISSSKGENDPKKNGEFIGKVDGIDNNKDVVFIYDNTVTNNDRSDIDKKHYSTGFLGWFKWTEYTWSKTTGTTQQYVGSVKADHAINIGFIGNENGNSNINVNSQGNISITNNITSSNNNSTINITSQNGAITQTGGNITGNNINLNANKGINNINIISNADKNLDLNAVNKGTGNVDITVNAGKDNTGNVNINQISTGSGNVSLVADGNINQQGTGVSVKGDRIDLTSLHGGIGNENQAIVVQGGQSVVNANDSLSASVNAGARDSIYLTQNDGDMRLGRVYSDQGDVTITVNNGNLVDALPTGETINQENTDELIAKWKELGLIDNGDEYTQSEIDAINSYKDSVKDEYAQYESQKDYYDKNNENISQAYKDAYNKYNSAKQDYDKYAGQYDNFKELSAYYQDENNVPKRDNYRDDMSYQQALTKYNQGKAEYDAMKNDYQGFADADSYIKAQMGDCYNDYTNPTVENKNLKTDFDNYSKYAELKNRYGQYDSVESYLNSAEAKEHMEGLRENGAGWKQEDLLYAIADNIINPDSGAGDTIIKDPNLKGNNITINVKNGSVGLNSDKVTTIDLNNLSGNEEALKQLANADASNVVWDSANGKAYIYEKSAIGIQMNNGGKLNVIAKDNVYLSGRTENNANVTNTINIENISAGGDIRIQGKDGIYDVNTSDKPTITGNDLLIQAGNGSIGAINKNMAVDLTGKIQAQATGNIYLEQVNEENTMQIYSVGAGGDIVLKSAGDMVSVDNTEEQDEESIPTGYIRSDNGDIILEAGGSVGTDTQQIRIKNVNKNNQEQTVAISAGKDIYIQGITTDTSAMQNAQGELNIDKLSANGNVKLDVNGTINVIGNVINNSINADNELQITAKQDINVDADITNKAGTVILSSDHDLNLNNGVLSANKVDLVASTMKEVNQNIDAGRINQNKNHSIITDNLVVLANNGIDLDSKNNNLQNVAMQNFGKGNINLANNGEHDLNVNIGEQNDGDIIIHNYDGNKQSNMEVSSQLIASGNIHLINEAVGNITADKEITANNDVLINAQEGNITLNGTVEATENNVDIATGKGDITADKEITANNDVLINAQEGNITLNGAVEATENNIDIATEKGDITANGAITANNDVVINNKEGNIVLKDVVKAVENNVKVTVDKGNILADKEITANNDVLINAQEGNITLNGAVEATENNVDIATEKGDITANEAITANNDVVINNKEGNIVLKDIVKAVKNNVKVTVNKGNILADKEITANNDVLINAQEGNITLNGAVEATENNVDIATEKGDITANGAITTNNDVVINNKEGNIVLKDVVKAVENNVKVTVNKGNILADKEITANNDVLINAQEGNITLNGAVEATENNIDIATEKGNITADKEITANNGVLINAQEGNITLNGAVEATENNIDIATEKGDITANGAITADKDILINTINGNIDLNGKLTTVNKEAQTGIKISTQQGNISTTEMNSAKDIIVNTAEGSITLGSDEEDEVSTVGKLEVTANQDGQEAKDIAVKAKLSAKDIFITNKKGNILADKEITANNDVLINAQEGNITLNGAVEATENNVDIATEKGNITADKEITANNDVLINAQEGNITLNGAVEATENNVDIATEKGDITANGVITADKDILINTINGNIDLNGKLTTVNKETQTGIKINTQQGNISTTEMNSAKDIIVNTAEGSITLGSNEEDEVSTVGKLEVTANQSSYKKSGYSISKENNQDVLINAKVSSDMVNITNKSNVVAKNAIVAVNDVNVNVTGNGDITLEKAVQSKNTNISLDINTGNIKVKHDILAGNDITVNVAEGNIDIIGTIQSGNDSNMNAKDGYIAISGKVDAGNDSIFKAQNGDITIDGNVDSGNKIEATVIGEGNISFNNEVKATDDIKAIINGNGDIAFNGNTLAKVDIIAKVTGKGNITTDDNTAFNIGNDIEFIANEGNIFVGGDVLATNNATFVTNTGNIIFDDKIEVDKGNININVNEVGDITNSNENDAELITNNGNISINHKGNGNINLENLYAKNKVDITAQSGNLMIGTVNGDLVAILLKDKNKDMDIENVIAGTQVIVAGDEISLDEINQRPDNDGMLIITPEGSDDGEAIDNLEIGNIKTNTGIRFNHLWVNNANIHIDEGQLHLEKLFVENEAHFSNNKMTTTIYGVAPKLDGSNSIYWNNTSIGRPDDDLDNWLSNNKDNKWTYLKFTKEGNIQLSNAILIHLDKDYYSYNQRFSGENLTRYLDDAKAYDVYETYYKPGISFFNRYGVYEVEDTIQNNQDEKQKIIVEV